MVGFACQTTGCVLRALTVRQRLRAGVWEMTGGVCEWPGCHHRATELAHIHPRGMGHTGYRDTFDNVMAACWLHARITDMEHPDAHDQWSTLVHALGDTTESVLGAMIDAWDAKSSTFDARAMLAELVARSRARNGYNVDAMQSEIDNG